MADPMFATPRPSNSLSLNINDVIEVIGDDLNSGGGAAMMYGGGDATANGGGAGGSAPSEAEYSTLSTATTTVDPMLHIKQKAYVRIIEQPQPKALRFRYICEGRSAGSIPGVSSTAENKTFPGIQVMNYTGPAVVVVSCVTVDPPHRPHPHNLVGKEGCKKGVCTMTINNESMQCVFSNLGIQCVKRKDVEEALRLREEIRVDPYQTGFSHRSQPQSIDLNALRLCFQVFLEGQTKGKFTFPLKPVVSEAIYDKKATCDLLICKLSDCTSSVAGGKEVILLCDKVTKEDIQVRFYEVTDGLISWEAFGDFQPSDVHKQVAIAFKTPRYRTLEIENPVKVFIQLQRPSDKTTSEPRPFEYLPLDSDPDYVRRKIARLGNASNTHHIGRFIAENIAGLGDGMSGGGVDGPRPMRVASRSRGTDKVKVEPPDGLVGSPLSPSISPSLPTTGASPWIKTMSPQHYTVPSPSVGSLYPHHSPSSHLSPPPPQQPQLYYGLQGTTPPPPSSQSPYSAGGAAGVTSTAGSSYSMVLGSSVGGIVTVTSPIISPSADGVAGGPLPPTSGTSDLHLLDLDSQRFVEQQHLQQHQHLQNLQLQQHNLLPNNSSNNTDFDMNQINSAELRSLLDTGADMTAPFVEAHLSENLSSNLNIIDPNPAVVLPTSSAPSNNLNNNLDLPLAVGGGAFMPNIMGGGGSGGSKGSSLTVTNFCDSLNTPTPSSDSLTNLKSELELLNNS